VGFLLNTVIIGFTFQINNVKFRAVGLEI